MIVRVIDWSKASLTRYHNSLPWPTFRHLQSEGTRWSDNKSLPTIISHDHLPRSLSTACRVMMALPPPSVIMTTQNISPPLKKNQSFWYYIYQPSHKEEGKLAIPSKRSTDLSPSLWPWLTKPSEGVSGHPIRTPFAGGTTKSRTYIGWDRASIHLATTWITRDVRLQQ